MCAGKSFLYGNHFLPSFYLTKVWLLLYCTITHSCPPVVFNFKHYVSVNNVWHEGRRVKSSANKMMLETAALSYRSPSVKCSLFSSHSRAQFHFAFPRNIRGKLIFSAAPHCLGKYGKGTFIARLCGKQPK